MSARNALISMLLFLGIGAAGGGVFLIISPSGKLIGNLPLSILEHSPFTNFLIPGIILFLVLGLTPCLIAFALAKKTKSRLAEKLNVFKDMHWSWSFSIYIAVFVQGVGWLQTFYMFYSIPVIIVTLLPQVRAIYKK
jgi:hypothetical protein